jgi:hypothetical protein
MPFRQPERQFGKCRRQRVKVIVLEFAASFVTQEEALATPKVQSHAIARTPEHKWMNDNSLVRGRDKPLPKAGDKARHPKCRTMHIHCTSPAAIAPKAKPLAGFGRQGLVNRQRDLSCFQRRCVASPAGNGREAMDR